MSSSRERKFFCHCCENEISLSSNAALKCPLCESECIEENAQQRRSGNPGVGALLQGINRLATEASSSRRSRSPAGLSVIEQMFGLRESSPNVGRQIVDEVINQLARAGRVQDGNRFLIGHLRGSSDSEDDATAHQNRTDPNSLPEIAITQHHIREKTDCAICREDFELGTRVVSLPCTHLYHKDCIQEWLAQCDTCPVCRLSVSHPRGQDGNTWDSFEEEVDPEGQFAQAQATEPTSELFAQAQIRDYERNPSACNVETQTTAPGSLSRAPRSEYLGSGHIDEYSLPEPVFQPNQHNPSTESRRCSQGARSDSPPPWPFNTLFEKP